MKPDFWDTALTGLRVLLVFFAVIFSVPLYAIGRIACKVFPKLESM